MLPSVEAYLKGLPFGLESYPRFLVKGAVTRAMLETSGIAFPLPAGNLPEILDLLLREEIGLGAWLPETYHGALMAAVYDVRFRDRGGLPALEAWALEGNRKLLRSALYRIMFLVASPERILIGAEKRWGAFHRGSVVRVVEQTRGHAKARLTYPPNLFTPQAAIGFGTAVRAALEAAGATRVEVTGGVESDTSTLYVASWAA